MSTSRIGATTSPSTPSRWRRYDWYERCDSTVSFVLTKDAPSGTGMRNSLCQVEGFCEGQLALRLLKGDSTAASVLMSVLLGGAADATTNFSYRFDPVPLFGDVNGSVHASLDFTTEKSCSILMLGYEEML